MPHVVAVPECNAVVAQLVEHWLPKPRVTGSSPAYRSCPGRFSIGEPAWRFLYTFIFDWKVCLSARCGTIVEKSKIFIIFCIQGMYDKINVCVVNDLIISYICLVLSLYLQVARPFPEAS